MNTKQELPGIILIDNKRFLKINGEMKPVCGAKTRSGAPCKNPPMVNGRCRMHGGKSLGGVASPRFKHGRYSKYAPKRILERYEEAISDVDLLRLDDEIALTDVHISEIVETLDSGDSRRAWLDLRGAYNRFKAANISKDGPAAARALNDMGKHINQGVKSFKKWDTLFRAFETRRKLVEAERKRRMEMQMMVSAEELNIVLSLILNVIKDHVPKERLPIVTEGFKKIILG